MNKQQNNKWPLFKGYFSLTMIILLGCVLAFWGTKILLNDWPTIRASMGVLGNIVLAPFIIGFVFVIMGVTQLLSMIKNERRIIE